ncbi:MAG: helix-turn-helix domain-containing protein [Clostridia bacterium]|nr:helix-turn-helix domain-containing protein [Clostridia bacterium]
MNVDISGIELTQGEENLILMQKSLPENGQLWLWNYSLTGRLCGSTCPDAVLFDEAFRNLGGLDKALALAEQGKTDAPVLIGSSVGLAWAVFFERERNNSLLFVLGPVVYERVDRRTMRVGLGSLTHDRRIADWAGSFLDAAERIPLMRYPLFTRYAALIHNALNHDQIGPEAVLSLEGTNARANNADPAESGRDRNRVYAAERALLRMVRNGDLLYENALGDSMQLSGGTPVQGADPLRQAKTSITVFTTLVSRAAMEGGLSPEVAYPLGDSYIQAAEGCRDLGELSALAAAMIRDFTLRVRRLRVNPDYSHAVRKCCDYIELNLSRKIRTEELAALTGYSPYYLTEKFSRETGMTLANYIRYAKVERAKILLETTKMSVREIAEALGFNTTNYFIAVFRETTGYSPGKYQKERRE